MNNVLVSTARLELYRAKRLVTVGLQRCQQQCQLGRTRHPLFLFPKQNQKKRKKETGRSRAKRQQASRARGKPLLVTHNKRHGKPIAGRTLHVCTRE